jgi:hypothetical protein
MLFYRFRDNLQGAKMKLPFLRKEKPKPVTWPQKLGVAIDHAFEAGKMVFEPLGDGLYVYAFPPVYDFEQDRERFNREAHETAQQVFGEQGPGEHTLIKFSEIRDGHELYALDYTAWAGDYAQAIAEEVGLYFMVRADEFFQIVAQESERAGLAYEKHMGWDVHLIKPPYRALFPTGDVIYEAIGRGTLFPVAVRDEIEKLLRRFPHFEAFHRAVVEALPEFKVEISGHELIVSGPKGQQAQLNYWVLPKEIGTSGAEFDAYMKKIRGA